MCNPKITDENYNMHITLAGICQLLSDNNPKNRKASGEKQIVFLHLLYLEGLIGHPLPNSSLRSLPN